MRDRRSRQLPRSQSVRDTHRDSNGSSRGDTIPDPETGQILGYDISEIGTVSTVTVQERLAVAKIEAGCSGIKETDFVRLMR